VATALDLAVYVSDVAPAAVLPTLRQLKKDHPGEHELARFASKPIFEKHDYLLSPSLRRVNFASARLDVPSLEQTLEGLLGEEA
jgi:hypothetical protein